ncbi:MAG: HAMP domain-containing sensor histidine kinase [Planctomycetota bacterium]|nr:HAMP domain-containing sensor histidine kinase [Planctomycetota bacterium]MDA0932564.1 HAMP domain-containing sensor histidine kinase [Planctomycetota bacterium]
MRKHTSLVFGLVVLVCLTQIGWWITFQVREASRLETVAEHLDAGEIQAALRALEATYPGELAETARSRRAMFASEGAALGLLVLVGVVFFYATLLRERRFRDNQQRFLAGATHELKTPLTTVRLGLESLEQGTLPEPRRGEYLRGMVRELDRLERGLTNILTAAGLEASGTRPREVDDLAADTRRAIEAFRERCAAAELSTSADELQNCPVRRDPAAIRIVLHNLLDNAVRYTPPGGRILVRVRRVGHEAELSVTDTGRGIAREDLERIFGRFERGSGSEHLGGTGLGLALVRELVQSHGGTVSVSSDGPDRGSCFTLRLPLAEESA